MAKKPASFEKVTFTQTYEIGLDAKGRPIEPTCDDCGMVVGPPFHCEQIHCSGYSWLSAYRIVVERWRDRNKIIRCPDNILNKDGHCHSGTIIKYDEPNRKCPICKGAGWIYSDTRKPAKNVIDIG